MQAFRSLIFITSLIALGSFYFQNVVGPEANKKMAQLLISMKQKSPELEIPEGIFYDGIPNTNLYVQKKDLKTGKLYGIMIYRMTESYEDAAIILADSGMLQSTAEKKHLVMTLWSGEWFENMRSQELAGSAAVPYRRETFSTKKIILDFDGEFNMTDANVFAGDARAKGLPQIKRDIDSLNQTYDSVGRKFLQEANRLYYEFPKLSKKDSLLAMKKAMAETVNFDSIYAKLPDDQKQKALSYAMGKVQTARSDLEFKSMLTSDADKAIRQHQLEAINKFNTTLICLIFFFIGAPLGAIIRKGGLGIPVIISVLVFIVYYILDNVGFRMARGGIWTVWFGKGIAMAVLTPLAVFFTYKANKDSVLFNMDSYRHFFRKLLGLRLKRHIFRKEVIIQDPDYKQDATRLESISAAASAYAKEHKLKHMPNIIKVFFNYQPDHHIEVISEELEDIIEDLANTKDKVILTEINKYPIVSVKAHTRPFENRWMNTLAFIIVPVGMFCYFRMWHFRLRLSRDMNTILNTNKTIVDYIGKMDL
jgi:lipopolysaccharide export system permease protein